ncbi:DJ-1/PfpI family protein [Reyranella sp.]|uniref:DJ-1/PfpI family protein n=1 Tax=Reyranella sp. TaxID=1929291 RepID=UPI003D0DC6AB
MEDRATLDFVADRGARARYVTSVCTGSLVLGAAGLLRGYQATSHWYVREHLALLGAKPTSKRVVTDRNRMTGVGATAGVDFGLTLCTAMRGEETARRVQLTLEHAPAPPFDSGSPESAGEGLVKEVRGRRAPLINAAGEAAKRAAAEFR